MLSANPLQIFDTLFCFFFKSVCFFQIFAGIFPKNYEPPPGEFYFEVDDNSPVVQVINQKFSTIVGN
jgi:hypothetical protein